MWLIKGLVILLPHNLLTKASNESFRYTDVTELESLIKLKLYFYKPVKFDDNLSHQQITLELNKILEKMILKNPDQWIWSHDRWK